MTKQDAIKKLIEVALAEEGLEVMIGLPMAG